MTWQAVFQKDVAEKISQAKAEFDQYKLTGHSIYLQQAGNKLFSAVENYLMLKYGKKVRSYKSLLELVKADKTDKKLLLDAVQLHYFFYNAQMHMENYQAEEYFHFVLEQLEPVS